MRHLATSKNVGLAARPATLCTSCLAAWTPTAAAASRPHFHQQTASRWATIQRRQYASESAAATATAADASPETNTTAKKSPTKPKKQRVPPSKRSRTTAGSIAAKNTTQLKLWRDTLNILKRLETAQERLTTAGLEKNIDKASEGEEPKADESAASPGATKADETSADAGKGQGKDKAKGKDKTPAKAEKEGRDQIEALTNALHLLKTVLSSQGPVPQEVTGVAPQAAPLADPKSTPQNALQTKPQASGKGGKKKAKEPPKGAAKAAPPQRKGKKNAESTPAKSDRPAVPAVNITGPDPASNKYKVNVVNSRGLELVPVEENKRPVPALTYGLDRALFNPGVYLLQDPHSRVYNFDPYLSTIMPIKEFDFNALKQYVTSSKDDTLISMAAKHKMRYTGSTSSMSSMLGHFHFLLSGWRPINPAHTSREFQPESLNFTRITRAPAATFLHWKDGVYAIDADKEFDTANVLSMLGKSMEKLLTLTKEDYEKYRVSKSHQLTDEERNDPESFHYTTFGAFMLRSQLDAHDDRLPGTGMFDLKTRAVVSVRMDASAFQKGMNYEIRDRIGQWESFEREYFDMIRSAFLKYSLQVRMGRMDGIYVAFHNTQRIFGFQYVSINEMDLALHGTADRSLGDREFKLSLHLLQAVLDKAAARFPGRSLRLHVETRPSDSAPFMYIFAKPVTDEDIKTVQETSKASIEAFERNILGLDVQDNADGIEEVEAAVEAAVEEGEEDAAEEYEGQQDEEAQEREQREEEDEEGDGYGGDRAVSDAESLDVWEKMQQKVEETMENEANGLSLVRETIEDALEQSGLLDGHEAAETREYVDALLEAITRPDTEKVAESIHQGKALHEEETEGREEEEEEGAIQDANKELSGETPDATESTENSGVSQSSDGAAAESSKATEAAADGAEVQESQDSVILEDEGEEAEEEARLVHSRAADTISLKDLIIKLAAQVGATPVREPEVEMPEDKDGSDKTDVDDEAAPKNKRFERILSRLMARPKKTAGKKGEGEGEDADDAAGEDAAKTASSGAAAGASRSAEGGGRTIAGTIGGEGTSHNTGASEVMGMILTIRNKVNGRYVVRPEKLTNADTWQVEYAIEEIQEGARVEGIYGMVQRRRKRLLTREEDTAKTSFDQNFMQRLYNLSEKGRRYRHQETMRAKNQPVMVYGMQEKLKYEEVFGKVKQPTKKKAAKGDS